MQRQEQECRALAEREGYHVVAVHVDNDTSGYKGLKREGWEATQDMLRSGAANVLIAWHPDRLTRQLTELQALIDLVEGTGAAVRTVTAGEYDLATASGRMSARIVGSVAQGESEHKSERLRSKMAQLAAEGKPNGGVRRFGYEADGITIKADEAEALRWAVGKFLEGEGISWLVKHMPVPPVKGGDWSRTSLRQIFTRPRYAGLREHKGEIVGQACWAPILERDTWEQLQLALQDPARKPKKGPARKYLLSGVLQDHKGRQMRSAKVNGTPSYKTPAGIKGGTQIKAEKIEPVVMAKAVEVLKAVATHPSQGQRTTEAPGEDVATLEAELAELADLRGQGTITMAEWLAARGPLQERLEAAQAAIAPPSTNSMEDLTKLAQRGTVTVSEGQRIVSAVFSSITVHPLPNRGANNVPTEDRVTYEYSEDVKAVLAALTASV